MYNNVKNINDGSKKGEKMEKELTNSQEEYLRVIYILQKEDKVRITDIAKELVITKPSANHAVKNLKELGLVEFESYGNVFLTELGSKKAKEVIKRYDTIKAFLIQVLDVKKDIAVKEAKAIKYAISKDTIKKLEKYIQSIINVKDLDCDYNPESEKCRNCVKVTAKNRIRFNKKS